MKWLRGVLLVAAAALPVAALAQAYPTKPIKLVVGFTPGGGVDINGRLVASKLSELLGQQVIVDNRPGAGTNIAGEYVAHSAPDGYTLLINTAAVAINMALYKRPGYDTLRDFAPVSIFSSTRTSPSSSLTPAPSPASSIIPRPAPARPSTCQASSSRRSPGPTSCTSLTKALRPRSRR